MKFDKSVVLVIAAFICISFGFSCIVIKDFSNPLLGWEGLGSLPFVNHDFIDQAEYTGFYIAKNLSFNPFPHLNLINNQAFYPYGVNNVFQDWVLEKDIFYALLYSFFGIGPWLQIYYLFSVLITAIGAFILLYGDYGLARAFGAAFLISFGNFYAIFKYPHHLVIAVVHWLVLGVIVDFLIAKRAVIEYHIPCRLVLVRLCLLLLSFGLNFGYIIGFGLMSFTVSTLFVLAMTGYRCLTGKVVLLEFYKREINLYKKEFLAAPSICFLLIILSVVAGYIYLPLFIQIAKEAKDFNFTEFSNQYFWTNPFRLLIPYFPVINSPNKDFSSIFYDSPEATGGGSTGWFLLILGAVSLWQNRKRITIFIPLLIIFIFCLLYIPDKIFTFKTLAHFTILILAILSLWFTRKRMVFFIPLLLVLLGIFFIKPPLFLVPTLKIFPWFVFNRVAGRCTVLYPVILCLFALHANLNVLRPFKKRLLSAILVILACIEFSTAYSFKLSYQPYQLDRNLFAYMNYVKRQQGEAVLDWPFCIAGGGGAEGICPYYRYTSGLFTLRRFHEKKVMGQYFGRLHPSQVEPYFQAGWNYLFLPDDKVDSRQRRCFNQAEWSFFSDFYKFNDFAGINLYVERLPEGCDIEFYKRFGNPAIETIIPGVGRVKFIPKSPKLREQVNLALGTSLRFERPSLDLSESDLLRVSLPYGLTTTGLTPMSKDQQVGNFRTGTIPKTGLHFKLPKPQKLELAFNLESLTNLDNVSVEINGVAVETFSNINVGNKLKRNIKFTAAEGLNDIIITYQKHSSFFNMIKNDDKNVVKFGELSISASNNAVGS